MNVDNLEFSSRCFLDLIESQGVNGSWSWQFAENRHVWSPGLFRVLGFDPQTTRPSYDRLVGLIHPQDRDTVDTGVDLLHGVTLGPQTLRIRRPDGAIRVLSSRIEIYLTPDGRPRGAAGVVLDVTHQEILREARMAEQRRRRAWYDDQRILTFFSDQSHLFTCQEEASELTGLSSDEIAADAFVTIVADEREHARAENAEALAAGRAFRVTPHMRIARHDRALFEAFIVPIRDAGGAIREWAGITRPMGSKASPATELLLEGLEQAIDGRHMRAARALLDWSMTDLAQAAGLSLSTVKRMEENVDGSAPASRRKAVATLRRFGIRFSLMEGNVIGVSAT
ncbi:hypothetical protein ASF57_05025 [Methylobacterium sp. Leaf117]|nr:hypothetical protein ASF57_05025 [Methylobacterium sp. Leaf117]